MGNELNGSVNEIHDLTGGRKANRPVSLDELGGESFNIENYNSVFEADRKRFREFTIKREEPNNPRSVCKTVALKDFFHESTNIPKAAIEKVPAVGFESFWKLNQKYLILDILERRSYGNTLLCLDVLRYTLCCVDYIKCEEEDTQLSKYMKEKMEESEALCHENVVKQLDRFVVHQDPLRRKNSYLKNNSEIANEAVFVAAKGNVNGEWNGVLKALEEKSVSGKMKDDELGDEDKTTVKKGNDDEKIIEKPNEKDEENEGEEGSESESEGEEDGNGDEVPKKENDPVPPKVTEKEEVEEEGEETRPAKSKKGEESESETDTSTYYCFVSEYVQGSDLHSLVEYCCAKKVSLPLSTVFGIFSDVLYLFNVLHKKSIYHGSLDSRSIKLYLGQDGCLNIKMGDFFRLGHRDDLAGRICCPPKARGKRRCDSNLGGASAAATTAHDDLYSLGVVFLRLYYHLSEEFLSEDIGTLLGSEKVVKSIGECLLSAQSCKEVLSSEEVHTIDFLMGNASESDVMSLRSETLDVESIVFVVRALRSRDHSLFAHILREVTRKLQCDSQFFKFFSSGAVLRSFLPVVFEKFYFMKKAAEKRFHAIAILVNELLLAADTRALTTRFFRMYSMPNILKKYLVGGTTTTTTTTGGGNKKREQLVSSEFRNDYYLLLLSMMRGNDSVKVEFRDLTYKLLSVYLETNDQSLLEICQLLFPYLNMEEIDVPLNVFVGRNVLLLKNVDMVDLSEQNIRNLARKIVEKIDMIVKEDEDTKLLIDILKILVRIISQKTAPRNKLAIDEVFKKTRGILVKLKLQNSSTSGSSSGSGSGGEKMDSNFVVLSEEDNSFHSKLPRTYEEFVSAPKRRTELNSNRSFWKVSSSSLKSRASASAGKFWKDVEKTMCYYEVSVNSGGVCDQIQLGISIGTCGKGKEDQHQQQRMFYLKGDTGEIIRRWKNVEEVQINVIQDEDHVGEPVVVFDDESNSNSNKEMMKKKIVVKSWSDIPAALKKKFFPAGAMSMCEVQYLDDSDGDWLDISLDEPEEFQLVPTNARFKIKIEEYKQDVFKKIYNCRGAITFQSTNVVGCGVTSRGNMFFSYMGEVMDTFEIPVEEGDELFPYLCVNNPGVKFDVNFGKSEFTCVFSNDTKSQSYKRDIFPRAIKRQMISVIKRVKKFKSSALVIGELLLLPRLSGYIINSLKGKVQTWDNKLFQSE